MTKLESELTRVTTLEVIPLPAILKAVGWKVQMKKAERAAYDQQEKDIGPVLDELEVALAPWKS